MREREKRSVPNHRLTELPIFLPEMPACCSDTAAAQTDPARQLKEKIEIHFPKFYGSRDLILMRLKSLILLTVISVTVSSLFAILPRDQDDLLQSP